MQNRIAYMPLNTYPEAAPDGAVIALVGFAAALGCGLHVATCAVDIPPVASPLGGFGHSRLRDFTLGGATKEVFSDLRMPVRLAH